MSDTTRTTSQPEPDPVPNDGKSIRDLVIADFIERKAFGLDKYGTILQAHNGRDPLKDAYQEAMDLAAYLRQLLEERNGGTPSTFDAQPRNPLERALLDSQAERDKLAAQVLENEQDADRWTRHVEALGEAHDHNVHLNEELKRVSTELRRAETFLGAQVGDFQGSVAECIAKLEEQRMNGYEWRREKLLVHRRDADNTTAPACGSVSSTEARLGHLVSDELFEGHVKHTIRPKVKSPPPPPPLPPKGSTKGSS